MAIDVVCNMKVDEKAAKWRSEHGARTYFFCSAMCKQELDRNPGRFIKPA